MKKGMLKGQRRELLFTVIFIMILTVSLNMIAFIWFQLRVYHMTFQQEFVYVKEIQELSVRFFCYNRNRSDSAGRYDLQ